VHRIYKLIWTLRAIFWKLIFRRFDMPGYIGPPAFIYGARRISIGKRVRIFPGLRAECHGSGELIIHENVSIGQNFHIICSSELHIESGCLISGDVFITDTDHSYDDVERPVFDQENMVASTKIGKNCFIGIGARIQAGTILGDGCIVGSNSVVRGVFANHSVIAGAPARIVKRYNLSSHEWERC
jgi:acetyltransferase-like isoleucine patch superfamily enzyme